jgi:hypothetical protein
VGWITKDRDARSWIGGEGLPSRGPTGQAGERAKATTGGFQRTEATWKNQIVHSLSYGFSLRIHDSQCRQSHICAVHSGLNCVCLGKRVGIGSFNII